MSDSQNSVPSEREKRAWAASKNRKSAELEPLTTRRKLILLKLLAADSGSSEFQIELGLNQREVGQYKLSFGIKTPQDAETMLKTLEKEYEKKLNELKGRGYIQAVLNRTDMDTEGKYKHMVNFLGVVPAMAKDLLGIPIDNGNGDNGDEKD